MRSRATQSTLDCNVEIVHDYLTQRGGAERLVLAMSDAFPSAPVHTSLYAPETTYPEFCNKSIRVSWLNRFSRLREDHRRALLVLAGAFSRMDLSNADVVLCSSSGWAHGVSCEAPKLVYCYTPARWLYQTERYAGSSRQQRVLMGFLGPALRRWDVRAARSAERYLTLSTAVRDRISQIYGLEAEVIPPPLMFNRSGEREEIAGLDAGFLLCVARLLPYKNVDAVVRAVSRRLDLRLVVAGEGPLLEQYRKTAPPNVVFLGRVTESQLRWLYSACRANISASYEDFGLTPIEALAFGKPSVVLRYGGFIDTVVEGTTGLFFNHPNEDCILRAVSELDEVDFSPGRLEQHLDIFSEERFERRLKSAVADVL